MTPIIDILSSNLLELEKTKKVFEKEGFDVFAYSSVNEENVNSIHKDHPDIILLDLDIDNSDGIELCHQLKRENALNSFIVLFTTHKEEYIQIEAFKAGADDYIVKPINPRILVKRIKALLKRKPFNLKEEKPKILSFNNLKIDRESYLVFNEGESFSLPRKEFEMLFLLINKPQKVFSREEIFQKVWKEKKCMNTRIIDVHIRKIREKIGENIINTVKGVGYQLA
ncbi:MAG: response regulator transcription factor [Flavobacteriales bacterium]|nr:response regulator transcription factor [Flavobacteriales bacterium]NQX96632.1 response regulator transcription factor [Flavobacteriales bacterium]